MITGTNERKQGRKNNREIDWIARVQFRVFNTRSYSIVHHHLMGIGIGLRFYWKELSHILFCNRPTRGFRLSVYCQSPDGQTDAGSLIAANLAKIDGAFRGQFRYNWRLLNHLVNHRFNWEICLKRFKLLKAFCFEWLESGLYIIIKSTITYSKVGIFWFNLLCRFETTSHSA